METACHDSWGWIALDSGNESRNDIGGFGRYLPYSRFSPRYLLPGTRPDPPQSREPDDQSDVVHAKIDLLHGYVRKAGQ